MINCLIYRIIPLEGLEEQNGLDLVQLAQNIIEFINPLIRDYIWSLDPFYLSPIYSPFPHFGSIMNLAKYNSTDIWFIIKILLNITKQFPNLIASIQDTDGEVLLIETADEIPDWLDPTTSRYKTWIKNGNLCIINQKESINTLIDAVKCLKGETSDNYKNERNESESKFKLAYTVASEKCQNLLVEKIKKLESKFKIFHTKSPKFINPKLSKLLNYRPSLISILFTEELEEEKRIKKKGNERMEKGKGKESPENEKSKDQNYRQDEKFKRDNMKDLNEKSSLATTIPINKEQYRRLQMYPDALDIPIEYLESKTEILYSDCKFLPLNSSCPSNSKCPCGRDHVSISSILQQALSINDKNEGNLNIDLNEKMENISKSSLISSDKSNSDDNETDSDEFDYPSFYKILNLTEKDEKSFEIHGKSRGNHKNSKGLHSDPLYHEFMNRISSSMFTLSEGLEVCNDSEEDFSSISSLSHSSSFDPESNSDSETCLEYEILETIKHDPDLLMRLIEIGTDQGYDNQELLEKLGKFKIIDKGEIVEINNATDKNGNETRLKSHSSSISNFILPSSNNDNNSNNNDIEIHKRNGRKQKGLADINPEKIKQAQIKSKINSHFPPLNNEKVQNQREKEGKDGNSNDSDSSDEFSFDEYFHNYNSKSDIKNTLSNSYCERENDEFDESDSYMEKFNVDNYYKNLNLELNNLNRK